MNMQPPPPPPTVRPIEMMDTECYGNYWLYKTYNPETNAFEKFELYDDHPLDRVGLYKALCRATIVTFNGWKYDIPMIACALAGFTNEQLKAVSNDIIRKRGEQPIMPWEIERKYGVKIPYEILDHIDLIEVLPGQASLKMYGGRMHSKKMQDLPYEHTRILTRLEMAFIDDYCGNDLIVTHGLWVKFTPEIQLRIGLTADYGIDLRSKSDAQIAEAVFKSQSPTKIYAPEIPAGTPFHYQVAPFIKFKDPQLQTMLGVMTTHAFVVNLNGSTSPHYDNHYIDWGDKQMRLDAYGRWVDCPKEWACRRIAIGNTQYQMGSGGLHSCEENASHIADTTYSLLDVDVVSYYPMIIAILKLCPPQLGANFLTTFVGWIKDRIAAKDAGNKRKANAAKTKINGTFGKTGSKYSILFAPSLMIQTTITGQLALLMLIERLESAGIAVVSANTDGVVIKCRRDMHPIRNAIVKLWEIETGFTTEANEYRALFSRDVNSYMAFKLDGDVKLKGAFAPPEPVGPSWPNPANEICVDAVIKYILDGVPLERTIRQCSDIRKFVTVRAVRGGGSWVSEVMPTGAIAQKREALIKAGWVTGDAGKTWFEPCGDNIARNTNDAIKLLQASVPRQYLGKAVRWYYGAGQRGYIAATNGDKVSRSEGAKPCMELPNVMPPDINYDWYVQEAKDLLADIDCC